MITSEQKGQWERDGYFVARGLIETSTCQAMIDEAVRVIRAAGREALEQKISAFDGLYIQREAQPVATARQPEDHMAKIFNLHLRDGVFGSFAGDKRIGLMGASGLILALTANRTAAAALITAIGVSLFLEYTCQHPAVFGPSPRAFPVLLLGIALGTALALGGLKIGPIEIAGNSLWIPILIIGFVYVPYMARPIRGEILALREKEFVEAAVAQGKGPLRIMFSELLPNIVSTIIVFFTLNIANNMLLESALSFLGAGVRPPNASWGTMIADGYQTIYTAPHLTIVPGLMIVATVLSLNVFGDGLRDALDPKAKIRLEH